MIEEFAGGETFAHECFCRPFNWPSIRRHQMTTQTSDSAKGLHKTQISQKQLSVNKATIKEFSNDCHFFEVF